MAASELTKQHLLAGLLLPAFHVRFPLPRSRKYLQAMNYLHGGNPDTSPWKGGDACAWGVLLGWLVTSPLGKMASESGYEEISRSWIDEWMLNKILGSTLSNLGVDDRSTWRLILLIKLLTTHHRWWTGLVSEENEGGKASAYHILDGLLADSAAQAYLGVNRYQDMLWFNKESYEDLLWWLFVIATVEVSSQYLETEPASAGSKIIQRLYDEIGNLIELAGISGYQVEKLLQLAQ
jgi:hypothetical protein